MSFLDNLEDNLKALENQQQRDPNERLKRDQEQARVLAASPWAEKLKSSPYTQALLERAAKAGFEMRAKMYMAWLDTILRLEIRTRKLELRPTPEGIVAVFFENNAEVKSKPLDLSGDPEELVKEWLSLP